MAVDIDALPIYDAIIQKGETHLAPEWSNSIATLIQTLQEYLTQNGIILPNVTTAQRTSIANAVNGQIIYNTTTNLIEAFVNGAWVTIS